MNMKKKSQVHFFIDYILIQISVSVAHSVIAET